MVDSDLIRRLAAIVAADVAEYSRLVREDEEATLRALRAHRQELFNPLVEQYGGRIANTAGDSLLLEFPSAVEAVRCAIAMQAGLAERNTDIPEDKQLKIRIGINIGDVISEGDDLLGDGVNVAARLEGLADPGGICLSKSTREQVRDQLDLNLEDLGEVEVKNIARPVRVFKVVATGEVTSQRFRASPRPAWQSTVIAIGLLVVLATVGAAWWWFQQPDFEPADQKKLAYKLPAEPSIVVIPFNYIGANKLENEFLADGLSGNIIAALSQIPDVFVIARNTSFTLKNRAVDVRKISEEFGVRYILEGNLQKSENSIRITATLLDGISGRHLWSQTFDREINNIFLVQDEITRQISVAMQVNIGNDAGAPWRARGITSLKAWALMLQANNHFSRFTQNDNQKAEEYLVQALALDGDYAQAWALRGWVRWMNFRWAKGSAREKYLKEGFEYVDRALLIDARNPTAAMAKASLHAVKTEYSEAISQGEAALRLAPNFAENYAMMSLIYRFSGNFELAIDMMLETMRRDPKHPFWYVLAHGNNLMAAGRYAKVVELWAKNWPRLSPKDLSRDVNLIIAYGGLGDAQKSMQAAKNLLKKKPTYSLAGFRRAFLIKNELRMRKFISWLRAAGIPEYSTLPVTKKLQ